MASRKAEKEAARQRRLEAERAAAAQSQRMRRLQILGGVIVLAIAAVVVIVIVAGGSSKKTVDPTSPAAKTTAATVDKLLAGIPEHGTTLGNPKAPVTFTEYGDLECPICHDFALGAENQLIANEVRAGKVKLVYKSYETASSDSNVPKSNWSLQQTAAYAAGLQNKAWYYIELFYHEQGTEDTAYANTSYLQSLAKQVPGLNFATWNSDRFSPTLAQQVINEGNQAVGLGVNATPALIASGKTQTKPQQGDLPYSSVQSMIKSVS